MGANLRFFLSSKSLTKFEDLPKSEGKTVTSNDASVGSWRKDSSFGTFVTVPPWSVFEKAAYLWLINQNGGYQVKATSANDWKLYRNDYRCTYLEPIMILYIKKRHRFFLQGENPPPKKKWMSHFLSESSWSTRSQAISVGIRKGIGFEAERSRLTLFKCNFEDERFAKICVL